MLKNNMFAKTILTLGFILTTGLTQASDVEMKPAMDNKDDIESNLNEGNFAIGGNYSLNLQDPDGTVSSEKINANLAFSYYFNPNNELGAYVGYGHSKQKFTATSSEATSDTTTYGLFYRYNFLLSQESTLYPITAYVGAQAGAYQIDNKIGTNSSNSTDFSVGAHLGFNWSFSQEFALNIHVLQFDSVSNNNNQVILSQAIGVKYFL